MSKLNRFKSLVFQDITQLMSKKPFQYESIACFHNTTPAWRFWSFLEFSKRDGQYLNRTKENEAFEDNVNLPEALLALPRTQMFQSAFSKTETVKDSPILNINLRNLKNKNHQQSDDVSLKAKVVENTLQENDINAEKPNLNITKTVKNLMGQSIPEDSKNMTKFTCSTTSKFECLSKNDSLKRSPSKSLPRISLINRKGKSSFTLPMEATRLRRSKSFTNQIVPRYSSGVARTGRDIGLSMSKPGLSKPSIQVANMSSGSGKRNNRNRKKSKNNKNENQECQPPCPPPPPPPPCCPPPPPPPPPPCCPEPPPPPPPPKHNREKKSRSRKQSHDCQPEPPCIELAPEKEAQPPNNKQPQKKCDGWCPQLEKGNCYQSKCPEKKKKKGCPQPKPCPPRCFEPDPCEKPKAFCVGCPPNKKKNPKDRNFSTWNNVGSLLTVASRSFTSDRCENKNQKEETVEERFNKRFPKPGPACKEAKDDNKCKPTASIKPTNDKCNKSTMDKKSCQNNAISSFAKNEAKIVEDLMRKEFEKVQKCKQGRNELKNGKSSCKIMKIQQMEDKKSIDSLYKTILASFLKQQNNSKTNEKINNHLSVVAHKIISSDSNVKKTVDKDIAGNFATQNAIKEMEPRNWLTSWLS